MMTNHALPCALGAGLLVVAVLGPPTLAKAVGTGPSCANPPAIVAHRGGNEIFTENTLGAFESAYTLAGAKVWETDLRFDSTDTPVILHDDTVDRTTPATGEIADLQASGSVRIPTDDGQRIPTEWEVLNQAQILGARVLLELKVMPANSAQWWNLWNRIDITVGRAAITLASFDVATLNAVRAQDASVRTALIQQTGYISAADVLAQGQTFEKYGPSYTKARFDEWHAAGIELAAWTPDDPVADSWNRLVSYPVDLFITDKPLAYRAWLTTQCPGVVIRSGTTPPGTRPTPTTNPTTRPPTSATPGDGGGDR